MYGTMQDVPLLISRILEHGRKIHGSSQVTTWTGEAEPHRRTFAEIGNRAAQLAHALRDELGVRESDVLGTLMWNRVPKTFGESSPPDQGKQRTAPATSRQVPGPFRSGPPCRPGEAATGASPLPSQRVRKRGVVAHTLTGVHRRWSISGAQAPSA